jgi:hypothetical protein
MEAVVKKIMSNGFDFNKGPFMKESGTFFFFLLGVEQGICIYIYARTSSP